MGIVVDLDASSMTITEPPPAFVGFNNRGLFAYEMHSWDVIFQLKYVQNPSVDFGKNFSSDEKWKIGIVQNEIFSKELFVFADPDGKAATETFLIEFKDAAVDMIPKANSFPFYSDRTANDFCSAEVVVSSKGYRLASRQDPLWSNSPSKFSLGDNPSQGLSKRLKSGAALTTVERLEVFQVWSVAFKLEPVFPPPNTVLQTLFKLLPDKRSDVIPLATMGPFSTIFWADIDLRRLDARTGDRAVEFGRYAEADFKPGRRVGHSIKYGIPRIKIVEGDGGRSPLVDGPIAAVRGNSALFARGLADRVT